MRHLFGALAFVILGTVIGCSPRSLPAQPLEIVAVRVASPTIGATRAATLQVETRPQAADVGFRVDRGVIVADPARHGEALFLAPSEAGPALVVVEASARDGRVVTREVALVVEPPPPAVERVVDGRP